jgi:hypothetical protein
MKSKIKVLIVSLMVILTSVILTGKASAQQPYVSFQVFYDELAPYGEWVDNPDLGYVWIPYAGQDFVPYSTAGHWILTDYGWTWMSDYRWGWAPFHYGRWDFDNYYGWFWIPDTEWGPAWVSWRRADGYYGWEPMGPGVSLSVSFGMGYNRNNDHWIFVRDRDIDRPDLNNYYIGRSDRDRIVRRSQVINNTYVDQSRNTTYVTGPARTDFQRSTGRQVNPVRISEYDRPGQELRDNQLNIYRPEITNNNDRERRSAPSRIINMRDVKQPSERRAVDQSGNPNSGRSMNQDQQPNTVNPRSNVNTINREQQNSAPPQNVRREQQQNNVNRENVNPPQNVRREQQQNNVRQENVNPPQNVRREQRQEKANAAQNARREQQSNTSKSSANSKKEQKKKSGNENDNKKNN